MPIYEYKCSKCGEVFEAFQKISDEPLSRCKFCGGKVEKLISHSSFQLKGAGWYLTDYAKKSQPSHTEIKDTTKSSNTAGGGSEKTNAPASKTAKNAD